VTRNRVILATAAIGLCVVAVWMLFPSNYGKVSPQTYEVAKALYSACLTKSEPRLVKLETMLRDNSDSTNAIPPNQRDWLTDILDTAKQGDWESAASEARRMMEDQVERR